MRKSVLLFFIFMLLLIPQPVLANSESQACKPFMTDEIKEKIKNYKKEEADLVEAYSIDVISSFWNIAGVNSVSNLIFGNPYCVWNKDSSELMFGLYPKQYHEKLISPIIKLFTGTYVFALTLSILISTLKLSTRFLSRTAREEFRVDIIMWFVVAIYLSSYWLIVQEILNLNTSIVARFKDLLHAFGVNIYTSTLIASQDDFNFTDIVVIFAEWLLMLFLNFVYIARIVMITILLMLGGLAGLSLLYRSTRFFFELWIKEFIGAIFLQSMHALLFTLILLGTSMVDGELSVFYKLGLLILFIPMSSMLFSWIGLSSSTAIHQMGLTGIKTVSTAVSIARQIHDINSITRSQGLSTARVDTGTDIGRTRISALAEGNHSYAWKATKKAIGKAGAFIGGTAGLVLGPAGVNLGSTLGGIFAKGTLQGSRNIAASVANTTKTLKEAKREGFRKTFQNIESRRIFMGNLGESLGSTIGLGLAGRKIGHALSGVSRQRLMNSTENGAFNGLSLQSLQSQYPGATLEWMQTNTGSAFYINKGNEQKERISPFGPADTSLREGEVRKIQYQLKGVEDNGVGSYGINNAVSPLQRMSNAFIETSDGSRYEDTRFNPSNVLPSSYFSSGLPGVDTRTTSDRIADQLHSYVSVNKHNQQTRHRGFA